MSSSYISEIGRHVDRCDLESNQLIGGKVGAVTNWSCRRILLHQSLST